MAMPANAAASTVAPFGARSSAIWMKPPLLSRLTSPCMRIAGRPSSTVRDMRPAETPPITASDSICHCVPMAVSGKPRDRSSIVVWGIIMERSCNGGSAFNQTHCTAW